MCAELCADLTQAQLHEGWGCDFHAQASRPGTSADRRSIDKQATVQRCISELSPHWTDEQLDQVVEIFQAHELL